MILNHSSQDQPACPHKLRRRYRPFFAVAEACREVADRFTAEGGVIEECFQGVIAPAPSRRARPFEIIFETPGASSMTQQVEAISCALCSILAKHCGFIAQWINL